MCEAVPRLRESIKTASNSDFTDFLENIRKHSARIGEIAMCHVCIQKGEIYILLLTCSVYIKIAYPLTLWLWCLVPFYAQYKNMELKNFKVSKL